jgi:hypothetical protein
MGARFRTYRVTDFMTGDHDQRFNIGVWLGIGLQFRLPSIPRLVARIDGVVTGYYPYYGTMTPLAAVGYRFSNKNRVDIGVLLDRLPVRTQDVTAFDETRTFEDQQWRPSLVLYYARVMADK